MSITLGIKFETPNDEAWQRANRKTPKSVEKVEQILEDQDYEHIAERQDVYEQAFQQNPDMFAQTFSIIDNMEGEANINVSMRPDRNGEEHFVALFRNCGGSGLNFAVTDGNIIIQDIAEMTEAQYLELARFCWINSLSVSFPDGVDDHFRCQLNNEIGIYQQTQRMAFRVPNEDENAETNNAIDEEAQADAAARAAAEQLPEDERGDFIFNERRLRAAERMNNTENSTPDLDKIKNRMKRYTKRLGKVEGVDFFSHQSVMSGALVYRIYKDGAAAEKDGRRQKDGSYPQTYDVEMRFMFDKNNNLNASYATPPNVPIARKYADEMVGVLKGNGCNYIEFEQPMSDDDKATFRDVCACNGVVPLGFNLSKTHVNKMINSASGTLTDKALLEYKGRLAKQLRKQLEENNIPFDSDSNDLKLTIEKFEAEVKYSKFNKACADIQKHIHNVSKTRETDGSPDAVKVIGAAQAFCEFFDVFEANCDKTIGEFMATDALNLPAEREQFLQQTGLTLDSNLKLTDLSSEHLLVLYKCMIAENEAKTADYFQRQFSNPDRDVADSEFVKDTVISTMDIMRDKAYALKESGGGIIYIQSLGTPKYHGPVVARNHTNQNGNNYNNYYQRRRGNRNY